MSGYLLLFTSILCYKENFNLYVLIRISWEVVKYIIPNVMLIPRLGEDLSIIGINLPLILELTLHWG